jgi:hypothetical protein
MKRVLIGACLATVSGMAQATLINTNDPTAVAAFQNGINVVNFDSISGRTPQTITDYTAGVAVNPDSFIFDQLSGVQFSVGGAVGTNEPALYTLSGTIAGDAHSKPTVLGPVDFDLTTKFNSQALIEIFFPVKVSKVGFWLNPSLGGAHIIAADTNFAFSKINETVLEDGTVTAGNFVGIEHATADIGGFKIEGLAGSKGFTIDDFSYGGFAVVPEPGMWAFLMAGLTALGFSVRRNRSGSAKQPC